MPGTSCLDSDGIEDMSVIIIIIIIIISGSTVLPYRQSDVQK